MSLQAILETIRAAGDARVLEIEQAAQAQGGEILAKGSQQASKAKAQASLAASTPAARERSRLLHQARIQSLRIEGDVREELVEKTLQQARSRLQELRTEPEYPEVLRRLTQEALVELEEQSGSPVLEIDSRDFGLLRQILDEMGVELTIHQDLVCWGGLIARSQDGRVVVINTLEDRMEHSLPFLRRYLSAWFEEVAWPTSTTETPA